MATPAAAHDARSDVLLVCDAGGHLLELLALRPAWEEFSRAWVTLDKSDARSLLAGERVFFAHGPTQRNVPNLVRNAVLALRVLREVRPRVVLTTGAALAVPFGWVGRLYGADVVYVESLTRIDSFSLAGKLVAPAADRVYVQWPELEGTLGGRYVGTILPGR